MQLEYKDYYLKTINKEAKGLKLVLGGTGLGKTHGMREAVKSYLDADSDKKRKFIYITNRHNLISEQKSRFNKVGIKSCYLKSNKDVILELIQSKEIHPLLTNFDNINFFKFDENLKNKPRREAKIKKLVEGVENKFNLWQTEKSRNSTLTKAIEKELNLECDELYKIFRNQLVLVNKNDDSFFQKLLKNEYVWKLFPYVEFENNPEANILLVTIHKVLKGFFDGKKDIKIASVQDKIIFLDEFDFLEQEIIKFLCEEPSIINPLEFVRIFYEKFKHWSNADFWESSPNLKEVRDRFNAVIEFIDDRMRSKGFNFPNVVDFRIDSDGHKDSKPYLLFQTNDIITPKSFFLREKKNSWYIQDKKTKETLSPFELFNTLALATNKILGVFHYYQKDVNLVTELIQNIWNQKNDNTGGRYENYITENCLYHRTKDTSGKEYKLYKDKSPYEIGFRLVKLAKRINSFDPNSAELAQIELFTSPEAVIAKLADSNLVFALSATTDIPRTLKCFTIDWLKENSTFIPIDSEDVKIIESRRNIKRDLRKTEPVLRIANKLIDTHPVAVVCESLLKNGSFTRQSSDSESANRARCDRVLKIFETLYHSLNSSKYSHLIFVTSFSDFKEIIDYKNNKHSLLFIDCDKSAFDCTRCDQQSDKFYNITLNRQECSLILLNSEDAKALQENPQMLERYTACFNLKHKVFVVTQYQSASNGINLPCFESFGQIECDFKGIHLLETKHFWFDNSEDINEFKNNEKQALWYLWKLLDAGQIDSSEFRLCLSARDPKNPYKIDIQKINTLYKTKVDEKILNAIALYHQAIGRIERGDQEVKEVDVTLDYDVFTDFFIFLTAEGFKDLISSRESITSSLILKIHGAVINEASKLNMRSEINSQKSIEDKQNHSRSFISEILGELSKVRECAYDESIAKEIKNIWTDLRESLLRQDFSKKIHIESIGRTLNIKRDLCFETKYINKEKRVVIDREKLKIYNEMPPGKKFNTWSLDKAYDIVLGNRIIKRSFENKGYKTSYDIKPNIVNHVLTPYIYQAILIGAIGEYSIMSLLTHHGIILEDSLEVDNTLFEVVDAKVKGHPIYFDFKNFSRTTLDKFSFMPDNINFDNELNSPDLIEKLKVKYKVLKQKDNAPILYIMNLYSQQKRLPDFFDENMQRVTYEKDSCIRVIPSILNPTNIESFSSDFESTLKHINQYATASL